jgi:hypothetical protein
LLCRRHSSLNEQCPKEYVGGFHGGWEVLRVGCNSGGTDVPKSLKWLKG